MDYVYFFSVSVFSYLYATFNFNKKPVSFFFNQYVQSKS